MNMLRSKIEGAVYGFAIGDAMGATTEFMHKEIIKEKFGKVTSIVGGGWLMLEPGEVTDDTQMTMCVMDAFMQTIEEGHAEWQFFADHLRINFIDWYNSKPKDIGGACARGIEDLIMGINPLDKNRYNKNALGNGSLMRALPLALFGPNFEDWNTLQGRFTHNNGVCSRMILDYSRLIWNLIHGIPLPIKENLTGELLEPLGHIRNTYHNSLYWAGMETFEDAIIGAVNHGGDADTIAAIAGSIAGARFGVESIPKDWITTLDSDVKIFLKKFINFSEKYVQMN